MSEQLVTVGCKLPNGLVLQVGDIRKTLNGTNSTRLIGGHGITQIDVGFWSEWLKDHRELDIIKNGLVFANERSRTTDDEARAKKDNASGFEQLDPDNPGRGIEKASNK